MIFVAAITDLASRLEEAHPTRRMPTPLRSGAPPQAHALQWGRYRRVH